MPDAFYVPDGDAFVATVHTRGPWSATHQHGGPPAALLARGIEAQTPGFVIARITVDFLLPVPIDRLAVRVETLRAGSKVQRLVARLLIAADSGSGVSAAIEHTRFTAINADLTVSVHRPLEGEWVGMDCLSIYEPHGVGLADTRLHDVRGPIGRALQSLVVEARS